MNLSVIVATGLFLLAFHHIAALDEANLRTWRAALSWLLVPAWLTLAGAHLLWLDDRAATARALIELYQALFTRLVNA